MKKAYLLFAALILALSTATGALATFPVTIEHKYGSTTIPAEPKRVVTVGSNGQDFVLALGVTPVGVREWIGGYDFQHRPWAKSQMDGAVLETVGGIELDIERVAALQPDLILGLYSGMAPEEYGILSRIAPTVPQLEEYGDWGIPWQVQTILTGRALGKEAEAEEWVAKIETQLKEARDPDFKGKSAAFVSMSEDGFWIFGASDIRTQFLTQLGFTLIEEEGSFSKERANLLDLDVLVAAGLAESDFVKDPVYGQLNLVQEGRGVFMLWTDHLAAAIGFNSPLSWQYLLDVVVPALDAAVDGDPSTRVPALE